LETALDTGLSEFDFWNMTLAEINNHIESYKRVKHREAQEQATQNYILADLIGVSVSRIMNKNQRYPDISTVYPNLFDSEEIKAQKQEQQTKASIIRFM
jgi:hypothetical protein